MKCKLLVILCLTCVVLFNAEGQGVFKKTAIQPETVSLQTRLLNDKISELMADRVNVHKEIGNHELASIDDYILEEELLEYESLMFPSEELYGSWDTTRVNPYSKNEIAYPDSFSVDCSTFVLPIDVGIKVTSLFGVRGRRMHNGIDLKLQIGDTVRSAFSGKVRIKSFERRGFGNYLVIRHTNGLETVYGHLSKFLVSDNEIVKAGQAIGLGGNTGRSTGSHLHFETRFLGQALNPSFIIDFTNGGVPHNDQYVLYKGNFGKNVNIYTSTSERIVYHRVKQGDTLSKIALMYRTSVSELCRLNGLTSQSILRVGQSLRCGTTIDTTVKKTSEFVALHDEGPVTAAYHIVQAKETLSAIAAQYKTTVNELCRLNNIQPSTTLKIGQQLCYREASPPSDTTSVESLDDAISATNDMILATNVVPAIEETFSEQKETVADSTFVKQHSELAQNNESEQDEESNNYHIVKQGDSLFGISKQYNTTVAEICLLNGITETAILDIGQKILYNESVSSASIVAAQETVEVEVAQPPVYYRIKEGDTLGAIAQKYGISVNKLCELNNITRTTILRIGRSLRCS